MNDVLLADALPALAEEVGRLLRRKERPDLLEQIDGLRLLDRCRCAEPFCSTLQTRPAPEIPVVGGVDETVALGAEQGLLVLDVVDGRIETLEILFREDIRGEVHRLFP